MNFNQFLIALRARRKAFAITFTAVILTAIAVALVVPKKYVASATLLMDVRDEQSMTPGRFLRDRNYLTTQMELVRSGRVAGQVARDLKLAQKPGVREAWEKATEGAVPIDDWIAAGLLDKLRVDVTGGNVLTVQFSASDPKHATAVANGFAKAYLDTVLQLRTEPTRAAAEWFDGQLKSMRAQVSQAQTQLAAYQKAKGITFADERTDVEAARLTELSTQHLAAKNATYDAVSRHKHATELLAHGVAVDAIPDVLSNAHIAALKVDLSRVEQRREQESTVLGENHPQYQRTLAEVAGLRDKIQIEMKKLVAGLGNSVEQQRKREDELKKAMDAQNERIIAMKDYRIDLAVLTRDVENAQRAYDAVLGRYVTTKMESAATSTNVAMLTPAVEPLTPAQPKVGLISGLAALLGAMLAAGVVFALETMDRRVRSRDDLENRLAVPSLGRLSRWQPTGGRLLPAPALSNPSAARALPHPW